MRALTPPGSGCSESGDADTGSGRLRFGFAAAGDAAESPFVPALAAMSSRASKLLGCDGCDGRVFRFFFPADGDGPGTGLVGVAAVDFGACCVAAPALAPFATDCPLCRSGGGRGRSPFLPVLRSLDSSGEFLLPESDGNEVSTLRSARATWALIDFATVFQQGDIQYQAISLRTR